MPYLCKARQLILSVHFVNIELEKKKSCVNKRSMAIDQNVVFINLSNNGYYTVLLHVQCLVRHLALFCSYNPYCNIIHWLINTYASCFIFVLIL